VTETLFVTCTPGLEPALVSELRGLGFSGTREPGGVTVTGPPRSYERINLWSRCASRVLLRVARVRQPAEFSTVDLTDYGAQFCVETVGERAGAWSGAAQRRWPSVNHGLQLLLRGAEGGCTVSVDTSGELLYLRGYRQEVGRAPLRETLASGVLWLADWRPSEPLWDVMCGSGTLVIEAAERTAGLAPGRNRRFAFESFRAHDAAAFAEVSRAEPPPLPAPMVKGSDLNAGALGVARRNARRAGMDGRILLERRDATTLEARPSLMNGLVVANLPYGKRAGERDELAQLYRRLGTSVSRACTGWRFAFLLQEGAEHLGLRIDRTEQVSNGGLRCQVVVGAL
jgi:putative N6-adenine-specific DNA methylase